LDRAFEIAEAGLLPGGSSAQNRRRKPCYRLTSSTNNDLSLTASCQSSLLAILTLILGYFDPVQSAYGLLQKITG
jgi:hypothetical protein